MRFIFRCALYPGIYGSNLTISWKILALSILMAAANPKKVGTGWSLCVPSSSPLVTTVCKRPGNEDTIGCSFGRKILPSLSDSAFFTLWSASSCFFCLFVHLFSGPQADLRQISLLLQSHAVVMDAVFVLEWSCQNAALKPGWWCLSLCVSWPHRRHYAAPVLADIKALEHGFQKEFLLLINRMTVKKFFIFFFAWTVKWK